ncbi:MAG TPA: 2-C-methyl-D-erythritol 2,4-cyclodiphosphate synthase, partial [Bacillota bacterium]|nr:2-C-methyl-D-erythritol 2,4-cyclodiphosphate synthase [Bacillota bacterium]
QDPAYKDADSMGLLHRVLAVVKAHGFAVVNLDSTIIAQRPKLAEYIPQMRENLSGMLSLPVEQVNVKATTTEKLGFTGRGEGIAAQAVVLLEKTRG